MNVIEDISNFIFIGGEVEKADILFIPGNASPEPTERAAALFLKGYAEIVMPSGRYSIAKGAFVGSKLKSSLYTGPYETEADFMADVAIKNGVPDACILRENQATYTMQNAYFSKKLCDKYGIMPQKAIICCKSFHARRAFMYYQHAFPETEFYISPVDVWGITKENWFQTQRGIDHVLGELMRCGQQFRDIFGDFSKNIER